MNDTYRSTGNGAGTNGPARDASLTDQAKSLGRDLKAKASDLSDDVSRMTDEVTQKARGAGLRAEQRRHGRRAEPRRQGLGEVHRHAR